MTERIPEQMAEAGRGISLAYEQFGDADADPLGTLNPARATRGR
jgi:hypothetical protein